MCGIAGIFCLEGEVGQSERVAIRRMMDAQIHRGPDDEGLFVNKSVVIGHRRLSIIDLSPTGHQPMANSLGTVWVAYNGEIYNHRGLRAELANSGFAFSSASDTEVIVHGYQRWGIEGLLQRLRGMFAFALVDCTRPRPTLFLARDRFGIKPLYYAFTPGRNRIVFASEVCAFRDSQIVPSEKDPRAWIGFLLLGSVPSPLTTTKGVRSLPPGCYLRSDDGVSSTIRYYEGGSLFFTGDSEDGDGSRRLRRRAPQSSIGTESESRAQIRAALQEAVENHLLSDAPLGVFLSGGIDSSSLVAFASEARESVTTLGVTFVEKGFSEEDYQREISETFRTCHRVVRVTLADFVRELPRFYSAMDQPTVDGLNTYFVAGAARSAGLKAVLSGVGADELFRGYITFRRARLLSRAATMPRFLRTAAAAAAARWPRHSRRKLEFIRGALRLSPYLVQRGLFSPSEAAAILGCSEGEAWEVLAELEPERTPTDPVLLQQFLEFRHYLADQLLRDTDVFGMAHSVEVRVPFLDHILVEAALTSAMNMTFRFGDPKPLLTQAVSDILPPRILTRPKQGFTLPMAEWIKGAGLAPPSGAVGERLWNSFLAGRAHWSRPWALMVMERLAV